VDTPKIGWSIPNISQNWNLRSGLILFRFHLGVSKTALKIAHFGVFDLHFPARFAGLPGIPLGIGWGTTENSQSLTWSKGEIFMVILTYSMGYSDVMFFLVFYMAYFLVYFLVYILIYFFEFYLVYFLYIFWYIFVYFMWYIFWYIIC